MFRVLRLMKNIGVTYRAHKRDVDCYADLSRGVPSPASGRVGGESRLICPGEATVFCKEERKVEFNYRRFVDKSRSCVCVPRLFDDLKHGNKAIGTNTVDGTAGQGLPSTPRIREPVRSRRSATGCESALTPKRPRLSRRRATCLGSLR